MNVLQKTLVSRFCLQSTAVLTAVLCVMAGSVFSQDISVEAGSTPDLSEYQTYRNGTVGIDIDYAWSLGIKGAGVKIADVEYSWDYSHEDLIGSNFTPGFEVPHNDTRHGTAVAGVLMAQDNGFGMTGTVPEAEMRGFSENDLASGGRAYAISQAIEYLDSGDVLIFEMQSPQNGPADVDSAIWALTKTATDAGIIVVAAAGNGAQNLDGPEYDEYRSRGDNGAIIVGSSNYDDRSRLNTSTYGTRVNVQGWGSNVATLSGYAYPKDTYYDFDTSDAAGHRTYTTNFGGTSSATPIVASAVVAIQSWAKQNLGYPLMPNEMRELLISTGKPQGPGEHVGPLPDVRAAIMALDTMGSVAVVSTVIHIASPEITLNRIAIDNYQLNGDNISHWAVYSINGQKLLENSINNTAFVDLTSFSSGVYFLHCTGLGTSSFRIVKE